MIDILKVNSNFRAIKFPPLPHSSKLNEAHEGMEKLVKAALATRDRFVFLGAVLAFYISLQRKLGNVRDAGCVIPDHKGGLWQEWFAAPITAGVHEQWVSLVGSSSVFKRGLKRRGVIIDYRKSEFSILSPFMIAYGVPVILRIQERYINADVDIRLQDRILNTYRVLGHTKITASDMNKYLRKHIPPSDIISQIRDRSAMDQVVDGFSFELSSTNDHTSDEQASWEPATPKAPESGPELETRVDFLARREREKAARIAVESPVERQRRISRENQHKKFQPPGENSKIGVFVWEWDGPREVRTLLHRGQYTETWDRAKISEMHYDSIHNEWDIWKNDSANFKLGRRPMDDEDEDFYENYLASIENNEVVDNNTILAPDVGEDSFRRDVAACYGFTFEKTDGHFTGAYEIAKFLPLVDRMQDWYGFDPKAKISRWDQVRANKTLDAERLKHLLRDSITGVDKELLSAMQEFVAPLVGNMGSPGPWSDMRGRSISNFGNPDIRVLRSLYTAKEFEDPRSPSRTLFSVEIVDKYGRVQEDHHQRQFFVWDAATALAVKRFPPSSSRSFGHIAECLLEHGIPYVFAILLRVLPLPVTICAFLVLRLGGRMTFRMC